MSTNHLAVGFAALVTSALLFLVGNKGSVDNRLAEFRSGLFDVARSAENLTLGEFGQPDIHAPTPYLSRVEGFLRTLDVVYLEPFSAATSGTFAAL